MSTDIDLKYKYLVNALGIENADDRSLIDIAKEQLAMMKESIERGDTPQYTQREFRFKEFRNTYLDRAGQTFVDLSNFNPRLQKNLY